MRGLSLKLKTTPPFFFHLGVGHKLFQFEDMV